MKSKHIFICSEDVTPSLRVYVFMVGSSQREQAALSRLQRCAAINPDAYLAKYSSEVCEFLSRLACQLYPLMAPMDARAKFNEFNIVRPSSVSELCKSVHCLSESRKKPKALVR